LVPARQVNGKTRLGVFASQTIKVGMPLTYNYRYFKQTSVLPFFLPAPKLSSIVTSFFFSHEGFRAPYIIRHAIAQVDGSQ